ncbi:MAG: Phthiodiolone/phenolphthiodiolone dimycocerosates ketoreductase [Candidatus Heimdallarchaeota archaeon LC_2]|nr:MAG: Phthiodiolone/phenolphthiodiolone dimycocerosates ketoreductase [Candidatus Heimdallarchaeota archaeon LC_2]
MKLGIYLFSQSNFNPNKKFDTLIERAKFYDTLGLDSLWISDGLTSNPDPSEYPHYETMSLISSLSQHTKNITFGTLASPHNIRSASLYSKMILSLDHFTKGRIIAGIGVGNPNQTGNRSGVKELSLKVRMEEFENYIKTLKTLFKGETVTNENLGIFDYRPNPLPYSKGGPKILIAGAGERKTLQQVAKYADMSNIWGSNENLSNKLQVLANWCDKIGRNFSEIENTTMRAIVTGNTKEEIDQDIRWYMNRMTELGRPQPSLEEFKRDRFVGTIDEVVDQIRIVKDIGISHLIFTINTDKTRKAISAVFEKLNT